MERYRLLARRAVRLRPALAALVITASTTAHGAERMVLAEHFIKTG
jgi:hypothetical protein